MPWITSASSDIGDRQEQQDRYLLRHSRDKTCHLLVVADGAGGHKAGATAAQTAIDCIDENVAALWSSKVPEDFLNKLIIECNKRVFAVGDSDLACTTLVLALIKKDEVFWGHVGDSRFYLIRDGQEVIRTNDHSMVELERQQAIQSPDMVVEASSNKIYMCLGARLDIVPETASSVIREGDTLILCSDGLWGQTDMPLLMAKLSQQQLSDDYLSQWTHSAKIKALGSSDNVTLVAARFVGYSSFLSNSLAAITHFFKH